MAQIDKPNLHFNTKLYTGNGSTNHSITGVGFQPDWTWIKSRDDTYSHFVFDAVRGAGKQIHPNLTNAETTNLNNLYSFDSDGFSLAQSGNDDVTNKNNSNFASWNWKANGQGSSNTDGSINTTYTSANTTAGFSICKYTGTGSNATVGHGLGAAPKMIIFKNTNSTRDWAVYHDFIQPGTPNAYMALNQTYAKEAGYNFSNATAPTSSVFSVGNLTSNNGSGQEYIAYCFADVKGYSKFGGYTGNGNANGTFVYTGFKPAFVIFKNATDTGYGWYILDNKRDIDNPAAQYIYVNQNSAEATNTFYDLLSNGFKVRESGGGSNGSGKTYIYMAFAENPIVGSNNVPATAR
jgi:hypothetical protein